MRRTLASVSIIILATFSVACGKKEGSAAPGQAGTAEPGPSAAMVELDLSSFGPAWKGYIAMAPAGAKAVVEGSYLSIALSEAETIRVEEAPGWEEANKLLADDKLNSNIKRVSATEVRWDRTPPIGKMWMVSVLVTVGGQPFSCGSGMTGTMAGQAMADTYAAVCKSIRKK